jgi:hypothetical protein
MTLVPGSRLGAYEIVGPLGAGGMGVVYVARDTRLGRDVAIKVLPADVAPDPDRLARFEREARAVSQLNHPNIVTLYEVGSTADGPFLVLERIEGESLRDALASGPMPIKRLLMLATQIADGLAKAHAAGVVHRDLKPDNVMVTSDGFAKVLDFGLAKLVLSELDAGALDAATTIEQHTASGVVLGTLGYLSPEQAAGRPADYRSDQFALGALLYEMATRERPFRRPTVLESLMATIRDEPEPVRERRPDVPLPLAWLIGRCLAKDPIDRYASTTDLARDLAAIRDHLSDLSRRSADTREGEETGGAVAGVGRSLAPDWARRVPAWVRWAAGVSAMAVVAAGAWEFGRRGSVRPEPLYRPLTFERGTITGARFAPDRQRVYFSMALGNQPSRVFVTHVERPDARAIDMPPGFLLAVSTRDELAVLLTGERLNYRSPGTLARVPASGGTPRPLVEGALYGDWGKDGDEMAVGRAEGTCEFPVGALLAATCTMPRVSPAGDLIAVRNGDLLEVYRRGGARVLSVPIASGFGHAWSPDGREVWYTASETGSPHDRALQAVDLSGNRRLIARVPGAMTVYDVGPDGQSALVATGAGWQAANAVNIRTGAERQLELYGRVAVAGLTADGSTTLLSESRGVGTGAYLVSTDGRTRVPIDGGIGRALSPDGRWALVESREPRGTLTLVPTGAGDRRPVTLPTGWQPTEGEEAAWSADGRLFLWCRPASERNSASRLFVRAADDSWVPLTSPGPAGTFAVSPDGSAAALLDETGTLALIRLPPEGSGEAIVPTTAPPVPYKRFAGEARRPVHWSADGRELVLWGPERHPARLYRLEIATGRVSFWRTVAPADPTGVMLVSQFKFARNDLSFVYMFSRGLNDLFLVRGLR